jgi:micrococcal nuclease
MNNKKEIFLLIVLIGGLFLLNYNFLDSKLEEFLDESETGFVERIVDGDTAIIDGNSTRVLGINTPEKGEKYYAEAKNFLKELILNKTVKLEYGKEKYDLYRRKLAYVFLEGRNINLELVKNGFANVYILNDKLYEKELRNAWEECLKRGKNLCERSDDVCSKCIELKNFNYKEQEVVFYNKCNFDCNLETWEIKDEGRKKFIFENFILERNQEVKIVVGDGTNSKNILYWKGESYVWTSTGDSLFLRDANGKLVLFRKI